VITYIEGDLFQSPAQVLVNTVNTVGVMGKGVAKEFKRLYPQMFREYRNLCDTRQFSVGQLLLYKTPHKWVLNFPTKRDWRNPSRPEYIEAGLQKLVGIYAEVGIPSLAMPLLGCGNGELDWPSAVKPLVEKYLSKIPIPVFVHSYFQGAPFTPEHRDVKEIESWLRSEPEHLPFTEVWKDLVAVLERKRAFKTLVERAPFRAATSEDPQGIKLAVNDRTLFVDRSELLDFWQQLRVYGFTSRQIAPTGLTGRYSYLMPVFAELPYVKPVRMADRYEQIRDGFETVGLQYIPRTAETSGLHGTLFEQSITI
jgi:O-acetyl-ADP-ribose deacetylase (regulator of RNase III)